VETAIKLSLIHSTTEINEEAVYFGTVEIVNQSSDFKHRICFEPAKATIFPAGLNLASNQSFSSSYNQEEI